MKEILEGKTILITGGTGFLGRSLIYEILKYNPQSIRVFSRDEVKHHKLQEDLKSKGIETTKVKNLIGDIRDFERLKKAIRGVDIVIHAAALKRLDILEYNVEESIKTNIIGTLNVVNACLENDVEKAIFVSTDKACSPVNTYGASKFVSERIFTETNYNKGAMKTIFSCVRYGNVLESTGSVIPFFEGKIKRGENITITDKRMTRFIISPQEAVELVFDAMKFSVGGEVIVPKLPAFKIMDLVQILKEKHNSDVGIELIGLRPGEKIHELMINFPEIPRTFNYKNRYVISSEIEKYHDLKQRPEYLVEAQRMSQDDMEEYSSEHAVASKEEVKKIFTNLGLL